VNKIYPIRSICIFYWPFSENSGLKLFNFKRSIMKIGVDIFGGDYAPKAVIVGAAMAYEKLPAEDKIVLIGDETIAKEILAEINFDSSKFEYVHTPDFIEMGEHPTKAFQKKPNSSISLGFKMLHAQKIDGFASAGNTGAMLVGAMYTVKAIPGVIRPCLAALMPKPDNKSTLLLDVGLNVDTKPDVLNQFAILGSVYAESVLQWDKPRVALMNIGSEEEKGNLVCQSTYEMMKGTTEFNFVGNVEGYDIFSDKADIVVADGYVGNVILKLCEGFYHLIKREKIQNEFFNRFNAENVGGSAILGINSNVIIGHGVSTPVAIMNMILLTRNVIEAKLPEKFKKRFNCNE
jgi:phosphate acyltransferase